MFQVDPAVLLASARRQDTVYPYAAWMPLPEAKTQSKIKPRLLILHSEAGPALTSLEALRAYVARDDVHTEPTFILDIDGRMAQLVGIFTQADCNASANGIATSVETQDHGGATLKETPWSDEQVEQLAGLAAWEHLHPDIGLPLAFAPSWNSAGIGPHRQFAQWSIYVGKTCPGDARVAQIPQIIARAEALVYIAVASDSPVAPVPVEVAPVPAAPASYSTPEKEDPEMKLYRKNGKNAVWLADGLTRQHVPDETKLAHLSAKYGNVLLLDPKVDLEQLGEQCMSMTGDV